MSIKNGKDKAGEVGERWEEGCDLVNSGKEELEYMYDEILCNDEDNSEAFDNFDD